MEPAPGQSGALERLAPPALALGLFLACFLSPQESPLLAPAHRDGACCEAPNLFDADTNFLGFLLMAGLSALAAAFVRRTRVPLYVMAAAAWLLFGLWPVVFVASYAAANRSTRRFERFGYAIGATIVIALPFAVGGHFSHGPLPVRFYLTVLLVAFLVAVPMFCGLWLRARRVALARLTEANALLRGEQEARARQVRAEERNRIAREMHDVVAHRIALIVLVSGGLRGEAAEQIGNLGRTALNELRDVLGVLRRSTCPEDSEVATVAEAPLPARLDELASQARSAGLRVEYRVEGEAMPAPTEATQIARERTIFRVAQEGLTNVMKYAPGARTVLTLRRQPRALEVTVENEPPQGAAARELLPSSGLGLVGLRERVSVLNGQMDTVMRSDGGYRVHAMLPDSQS